MLVAATPPQCVFAVRQVPGRGMVSLPDDVTIVALSFSETTTRQTIDCQTLLGVCGGVLRGFGLLVQGVS